MIQIFISGTPMTFQISNEKASLNYEKDYNPGNIFRHPCLGKIRCDEFILNEDGNIIEIICSLVRGGIPPYDPPGGASPPPLFFEMGVKKG